MEKTKEDIINLFKTNNNYKNKLNHDSFIWFKNLDYIPSISNDYEQVNISHPDLPTLSEFASCLTDSAKKGYIKDVIGRNEEIAQLTQILTRVTKGNPLLLGEPGVGKTAIVEGLALRIIRKEVPISLQKKEIWILRANDLLAGTMYRGAFEDRVRNLIEECERHKNIILFIDEIHTIARSGVNSDNSNDIANMLKPALSRNRFQVIGATTQVEYQKYLEPDDAFVRRFSKITVSEPTKDQSLTILRGLKPFLQNLHQVKISDDALVSAVDLSMRFMVDRYLPDKAIDLIDEAAAKLSAKINSNFNNELQKLNDEIKYLKYERLSLDMNEYERIKIVENKLKEKQKNYNRLEAGWIKQKHHNEDRQIKQNLILKINNKLIDIFNLINKNLEDFDFIGASNLYFKEYIKLIDERDKTTKELNKINKISSINNKVSVNEITEIISEHTKIPVGKLLNDEKRNLLDLPNNLREIIIGQDDAVQLVSEAIWRNRTGISQSNKPIGSFLFVGSTGVGKTALAKALAFAIFHTDNTIIKLDMGQYKNDGDIEKLIGGAKNVGFLTKSVQAQPYSVILLDEIEKANEQILDLLLSILDEGAIKSGTNHLVSFTNCIIIATSNLGAEELAKNNVGKVIEILNKHLKTEFINRFDEVIYFNTLTRQDTKLIAKKLINELIQRLQKSDYKITFSDDVIEDVALNGYSNKYGAREIQRYIIHTIENKLANLILHDKIKKHSEVIISMKDLH